MRKSLFIFCMIVACALLFTACSSTGAKSESAVAPVEEEASNVVYRNTFDGTQTDWLPRGGNEKFEYVDGALLISGRTATWNGAIRSFGDIFVPGAEYDITVTVKYTDGKDSNSVVVSTQQAQPGVC